MKKIIPIVLLVFLFASCETKQKQEKEAHVIGVTQLTLDNDLMTPEALWAFGRVSGQEVSPDGSSILYGVSYYSIE